MQITLDNSIMAYVKHVSGNLGLSPTQAVTRIIREAGEKENPPFDFGASSSLVSPPIHLSQEEKSTLVSIVSPHLPPAAVAPALRRLSTLSQLSPGDVSTILSLPRGVTSQFIGHLISLGIAQRKYQFLRLYDGGKKALALLADELAK